MTAVLLFLRAGGWKLVASAVVLLALAAALVSFGHSRYAAGQADRDAHWSAVLEQEHAAAALALGEANGRTRAAEETAATRIAAIAQSYEKERSDEEAKHARLVADLRSGAARLRVSVAPATCRGRGGVSQAAAAAGGSDDASTAELPGVVAERLADRAHAADNLARQLTACQAVVRADREAINGQR